MRRTHKGSTIIELLVAISIFSVVSLAVVILMQHAKTITVWGDKKNEALRQNREIMRRIGYILRAAVTRPAFGTTLPDMSAENPIINCTVVARDTDPANPPYPAGHLEECEFWATTEEARRRVDNAAFPVPVYPAPGSYDPRSILDDVPSTFSRLRLSWEVDTGNLNLQLRSYDGATLLATRSIVSNTAGNNVIRALDFRRDDAARSVRVFCETRSRDPNSRMQERRYGSDTQVQIPAWQ